MAEELTNGVNGAQNEGGTEQENEKKTYTKEEVEKLLQQEGDRRVSQAMEKAKAKTEQARREAERLATMTAEQKYQYELDQREAAIAEKERQLTLMENKTEASKILADKGISLELVDFVVADDAETMNYNINLLDKAFKASVKAEVEKRLAGGSPKKNLPPSNEITKEQFRKMSMAELTQLKRENPEIYESLKG